jgi:hypothetical protein
MIDLTAGLHFANCPLTVVSTPGYGMFVGLIHAAVEGGGDFVPAGK